jgi:hypothetical protein
VGGDPECCVGLSIVTLKYSVDSKEEESGRFMRVRLKFTVNALGVIAALACAIQAQTGANNNQPAGARTGASVHAAADPNRPVTGDGTPGILPRWVTGVTLVTP